MAAILSASLIVIQLLSSSAEQKNITAECGQNAVLPCRAPNNIKTILVVEWGKPELRNTNVFFYRDEQSDPEHQHPSFVNRVDLQDRQMKDGDVSVILKNVTIDDTGTYECRIIQRGRNRWERAVLKTHPFSIIYLSVVAPPPGQRGGTTEDGGKEDGGKEDGVSRGRPGLAAGLSVVVAVVVAAIVVTIKLKKNSLLPPPPDEDTVQQLF